MLTKENANNIGLRWLNYWNEKSVVELLTLFRDDVVLVSNIAMNLFPESNGRMTDKANLKSYWELVRLKFPNFKFKLEKIEFSENKVFVFYSTIDLATKAVGILTVDENEAIYKCELSYV